MKCVLKKKMLAWEIESKSSQTSSELLRGIEDKKKVSTFCFSFCFPWNGLIATFFSVTRNDQRIPIQEFDVGEQVCFLSFSTDEKMAISRELWHKNKSLLPHCSIYQAHKTFPVAVQFG